MILSRHLKRWVNTRVGALGLSIGMVLAHFAANGQPYATQKLQASVDAVLNETGMRYGSLGVRITEVSSGAELYQLNAKMGLTPASNLKVLTTATALNVLGADFRFETRVEYTGVIDSAGVLHGALFIIGSGDPTLGSSRKITGVPSSSEWIDLVVQKVKAAGITQIKGGVQVVSTYGNYNAAPEGWLWQDLGNYFGAPCYGVNFNENQYRLYFQSSPKPGQKTSILRTEPALSGVDFRNEVITGLAGSADNAWIFLAPHSKQAVVTGTIPAKDGEFSIRGAMPDPGLYVGQALSKALRQNGIQTDANATVVFDNKGLPTKRSLLWSYFSPTLAVILRYTNFHSINLYAESLLLAMSWKMLGTATLNGGLKVVQGHWSGRGLDTLGVLLHDGSGLSPLNSISVWHMTEVLGKMARDSAKFRSYYESFPVAGVSGTAKRIGVGTHAEGNMHVKSGTLHHVMGYSGYVTTRKGRVLAFSVIANRYDCSDEVMEQLLYKLLVQISEL